MNNTEDIIILTSIFLLMFVAVWSFYGLPTKTSVLIYLGIFLVASNILLWRRIFIMDKNTAVSFVKANYDIADIKREQNFMKSFGILKDHDWTSKEETMKDFRNSFDKRL